jgi:two-component system sensor histidine kinase TctE
MIRFRSLTARLLLALVAPLVVSAILIGAGGYWVTKRVVDYTSDRLLAGSVRAIAESITFEGGRVWVDLPPWSLGLLDSPQRDSVFYSVRQSGVTLTGYADLPDFDRAALAADDPVFRTITYRGRPVRQSAEAIRVAGAAAPVVISVAQTLDSRQAVRGALMTSVGLMEAGLVGLVALLVWPAAMWSLRPLEGLRRRLAARSNSRELDFTPVAVADVPRELQPVVVAFNALLGQLERSVDGVRRFTADASHQIRTPLAILKTHLTLLRRRRRPASDQESLLDSVEAVDRLQRLVEQLLALARADAVDDHGHESADLVPCVQAMVQRWRELAAGAGASLSMEGPASPVRVALTGPLLEQIVENLIDNAIRYGGPSIRVVVSATADTGIVEVCDDGDGLPEAIRNRPFERFVRGATSTGPGSGLGLSIVKALAERAGGQVVLSRPQGGGLCVRVSLPLWHEP